MSDFVIRVGPKTEPRFTTYHVESIGGMILEVGQVDRASRHATREAAVEVAEKECPSGWEIETTDVPFVPRPEKKKRAKARR